MILPHLRQSDAAQERSLESEYQKLVAEMRAHWTSTAHSRHRQSTGADTHYAEVGEIVLLWHVEASSDEPQPVTP